MNPLDPPFFKEVEVHDLAPDTFGKVHSRLKDTPCNISVLPPENQDKGKLDYVRALGADQAACIGNGRNALLKCINAIYKPAGGAVFLRGKRF